MLVGYAAVVVVVVAAAVAVFHWNNVGFSKASVDCEPWARCVSCQLKQREGTKLLDFIMVKGKSC